MTVNNLIPIATLPSVNMDFPTKPNILTLHLSLYIFLAYSVYFQNIIDHFVACPPFLKRKMHLKNPISLSKCRFTTVSEFYFCWGSSRIYPSQNQNFRVGKRMETGSFPSYSGCRNLLVVNVFSRVYSFKSQSVITRQQNLLHFPKST